jgi:hypothetical protein
MDSATGRTERPGGKASVLPLVLPTLDAIDREIMLTSRPLLITAVGYTGRILHPERNGGADKSTVPPLALLSSYDH